MSVSYVGLTQQDALAQGGGSLSQESDVLRSQLFNLIADLEKDKNAVQGGTLAGFQAAKAQLVQRFDELIAFCQHSGIDLQDAQQQVNLTDSTGTEEMNAAVGNLTGVALAMNLR